MQFIVSNSLTYIGCYEEFFVQFSNLPNEVKRNLRQLTLEIHGDPTKKMKRTCEATTMMFGTICLFPLALLLCGCYRRFLFEQRKLEIGVYIGLANCIKECKGLERITLNLADSFLDEEKCEILDKAIAGVNRLGRLRLQNLMGEYDSLSNEYSGFDKQFKRVKEANRLVYHINWGSKSFANEPTAPSSNTNATIIELLNTDNNGVYAERHHSLT